jgi:hypothetical protein
MDRLIQFVSDRGQIGTRSVPYYGPVQRWAGPFFIQNRTV